MRSAELRPVQTRLEEIADQYVPLSTPREALDYRLAHAASGFRLSAVAEHCGTDERSSDHLISELQQLLAGEVQTGRLEISHLFSCPSCGNVIDNRDDLPERPFRVFCDRPNCHAERVIDPARADAVLLNPDHGPGLPNGL